MTALPDSDMSYGTDMTTSQKVRRVDFGDGYSQRAKDGLNSVRQQWRLVWDRIPDSLAETLRTFFEARAGVELIEWTPYNQSTQLKWTSSNFSSKPVGTLISTVTVTLTQEFDL